MLTFRNDEERIFWKHVLLQHGMEQADRCVLALRERIPATYCLGISTPGGFDPVRRTTSLQEAVEWVGCSTGVEGAVFAYKVAGRTIPNDIPDPDPDIVGGFQRSSLVGIVRKAMAYPPPHLSPKAYATEQLREATGWPWNSAADFVVALSV